MKAFDALDRKPPHPRTDDRMRGKIVFATALARRLNEHEQVIHGS